MYVKICGIQDKADLETAIQAGATSIGLLVGLTGYATDGVDEEFAARAVRLANGRIGTTIVTHQVEAEEVLRMQRSIGADAIQLHGPMTAAEMAKVRAGTTAVLSAAVHVSGPDSLGPATARLKEVEPHVDLIVLDSRTDTRLGGTGNTHDWSVSAELVRRSHLPVMLAGGITPNNVDAALRIVKPAGVDVNSGAEDANGRKSLEKCQALVSAVSRPHERSVPSITLG